MNRRGFMVGTVCVAASSAVGAELVPTRRYEEMCHAAVMSTADSDVNALRHHHLIGSFSERCVGCHKSLQDIVEDNELFGYLCVCGN